MSSPAWNPHRLDVELFARQHAEWSGPWPVVSLDRLVESCHPDWAPGDEDVASCHARGEQRAARNGELETWLHLSAGATVQLVCQRCLGPVSCRLAAERSFRFVVGEEAAAALDADADEDVLAMTRALDLRALAEDELLLALPLIPRHELCPHPLETPRNDETMSLDGEDERPHPFAGLSVLKRSS